MYPDIGKKERPRLIRGQKISFVDNGETHTGEVLDDHGSFVLCRVKNLLLALPSDSLLNGEASLL